MRLEEKIERINELNRNIEQNKDFLNLIKAGNEYYRENGDVVNSEKQNRFEKFEIYANIWTGEQSSTRNEYINDKFLMNDLKVIIKERIEKHIKRQEMELNSLIN